MEVAICTCLAVAGFGPSYWISVRYESARWHWLMAAALTYIAVGLIVGWVTVDMRWFSLTVGAYVGLSLGSHFRMLWGEEADEQQAEMLAARGVEHAQQPRSEREAANDPPVQPSPFAPSESGSSSGSV